MVPKPLHQFPGHEKSILEKQVRLGFKIMVDDRTGQRLGPDRRSRPPLGHDRDHRRHVAAGAVAKERQPGSVRVDQPSIFADPFRGRVGLLDRDRITRFGRPVVVDKNDDRADALGDLADNAKMSLLVADDPAAAVEIHDHGKGRRRALWTNDPHRDPPRRSTGDQPVLEFHRRHRNVDRLHLRPRVPRLFRRDFMRPWTGLFLQ